MQCPLVESAVPDSGKSTSRVQMVDSGLPAREASAGGETTAEDPPLVHWKNNNTRKDTATTYPSMYTSSTGLLVLR